MLTLLGDDVCSDEVGVVVCSTVNTRLTAYSASFHHHDQHSVTYQHMTPATPPSPPPGGVIVPLSFLFSVNFSRNKEPDLSKIKT